MPIHDRDLNTTIKIFWFKGEPEFQVDIGWGKPLSFDCYTKAMKFMLDYTIYNYGTDSDFEQYFGFKRPKDGEQDGYYA